MNTVNFTFKNGKNKALTMSYDDGIFQDKRLIEIFNKHGIKGSFHINGGLFGAIHRHPRLFADRTMLYNPSAVSVWVRAEGKITKCKSGEMTKLN